MDMVCTTLGPTMIKALIDEINKNAMREETIIAPLTENKLFATLKTKSSLPIRSAGVLDKIKRKFNKV